MQRRLGGGAATLLISILIGTESFVADPASAATDRHHKLIAPTAPYGLHQGDHLTRHAYWRGISCVPYAREVSGIDLPGNARDWWRNAAGIYARGLVPQVGAVLAFRSIWRMPLGHVAVVERVINQREIEINQANWGNGGRITHHVAVVDVSEENDWSAVRVELGYGPKFGDIYPTYGFIYHQPDKDAVLASAASAAPRAALGWVITVEVQGVAARDNEVAEALPDRHGPGKLLVQTASAQR
ncbi:MAG: CHAP domain-containing protein [Acetobacteraceae bacterium]|nr:CHAP domain-containing protein [Acetobacteraceae bacterium]